MKTKTNKNFWQRIARLYAPIMEADTAFYRKICERIRLYLKPDMKVLELACGSGQLSFPLSEHVKSWMGTDFSENMVAQAKKRGETEKLSFREADATALEFEAESFDCVVIANALHIMPKPDKAMDEICRVLKPDGLLCAPTFLWTERKSGGLRKKMMSLAGFKIYREWDRNTFRLFIEKYGFEIKEMEMVDGGLAPVGVMIAVKRNK